jgi:DNA-binding NarL/FixJ family response regulator
LTNAEADVALRVVRGDGLKPISADLALSTATVKTHVGAGCSSTPDYAAPPT